MPPLTSVEVRRTPLRPGAGSSIGVADRKNRQQRRLRCKLGFMEQTGGDVPQGVGYDDAAFAEAKRHGGDANQRDWELRFLSALARRVTTRTPGSRAWEVHTLALGIDQLTVVVRAWSHDPPYNSRLLGLHEHLPLFVAASGTSTIRRLLPASGTTRYLLHSAGLKGILMPTGSTGRISEISTADRSTTGYPLRGG